MNVVAVGEMRVEVDEARQKRRGPEIDDGRACRNRDRRAHFLDAIRGDAHHRRLERRTAAAVDEARRLDDDRLRTARRGADQHRHNSQADA
jgi:hypothetical protein